MAQEQSQHEKSSGWSVSIPVYMVDVSVGKSSGKSGSDSVYNETVVSSNILVGNDLVASVVNDGNIHGANLDAGHDVKADFGGNLTVTAAEGIHQESHEESSYSNTTVGVGYAGYHVDGTLGKTKGTESSEFDLVNQGTTFNAGNDINVTAENVAIESGSIDADKNIKIAAAKEIAVTTAIDIHEKLTRNTSGTTTGVGVSYGSQMAGGKANGSIGVNVSVGTTKASTAEVMAGLNAELQDGAITAEEAVERIEEWRQQGVDIASIAAGVAAGVAGGDADIAAYTGRNAAENNNVAAWALPVLAEGAAASPVVIVVAIGGSTYVIQQINQLKPSDVVESGDNDSGFSDAEMDEVTKYTAGPGLSETQAAILNITKGAIILSKEQRSGPHLLERIAA